MTTWIIFFALALLSIVVFVFALRSQQDAEALASSRCRNGFSRPLALG